MPDWMTIRVELLGRPAEPLQPPPGRVMLAHADHTFADLADAIDVAFGRWDLSPLHEFEFDGRRVVLGGDDDDLEAEDSEELTLGEVGLRLGSRFRYTFDLADCWLHECTVEEAGVDAEEVYGDEPESPVPVFGWGWVPDQYGRDRDDDAEDLAVGGSVADGDAAAAARQAVTQVVRDLELEPPSAELAAAAARLRAHAGLAVAPYDLLFAAAGLDADSLPGDDERLWLRLAAAVVQPRARAPLDAEAEAAWSSLEPADWVGAVVGLVRCDVGQSAEPQVLVHLLAASTEVDGGQLDDDDRKVVLDAFDTVVELWQALGAVDDDRRLTSLGRWGLPAALREAWSAGE